jgi:hypothetical protein
MSNSLNAARMKSLSDKIDEKEKTTAVEPKKDVKKRGPKKK